MHGGVKFYRGAAKAARAYVEADRSRADDYYLGEGTGVAARLTAGPDSVQRAGSMDAETYEQWVAGIDVDTGDQKGRLRSDANGLRFVEVTVNGPKTWSLAAGLYPEVSAALDAAQDKAATEIVGWVAARATTRVGPRGRQVQVPIERVEAAVIRHYTSRAGDPHRHLHLQVNARVWAAGAWRGINSVGIRDSIEAINGIGHAAVATDPEFRRALAAHGLSLDPETSDIRELRAYAGAFSARSAQIRRHVDRYEVDWRCEHPSDEPGPRLREAWDRRAWADARPDKVAPKDGGELVNRWNAELRDLGYRDPAGPVPLEGTSPAWIDRDAAADLVVSILGAKKSAWNVADLRGRTETLLAQTCLIADTAVRVELAEDVTSRAMARSVRLLPRGEPAEHVRSLTSTRVLDVEAEVIARIARRAIEPARPARTLRPAHPARSDGRGPGQSDETQMAVAAVLAGTGQLVVVEGAAGAGKTTALRSTQSLLRRQRRRMVVVTPTLKAAEVAAVETGADGHSASWLLYQHGFRWDDDGHWTRVPGHSPPEPARLRPGDLLLVDEAGMLDQDVARALLTVADDTGARVALVGDRHQLPAVGRGGVLDHAVRLAHPTAVVELDRVRRFTDPGYAAISLQMRAGKDLGDVFDALQTRGQIVLHASEAERFKALAALGASGDLVMADTREQIADLNATIRDHRPSRRNDGPTLTTSAGEQVGLGDRVATRRNDPTLGVANRQTWTVADIGEDGRIRLRSRGRERVIPPAYATRFVELAYATTVHGAQGDTVAAAHVALTEHTAAAAAYVAMTRGRESNTAHLVAVDLDDARRQWVDIFGRDRADLGPAHARRMAADAVERYGRQGIRPDPAREPWPAIRTRTDSVGSLSV